MKGGGTKARPTTRRTLRALGGRRITVEGFGRQAFVTIVGGSDVPVGAWLSPGELQKFITAAQRILK